MIRKLIIAAVLSIAVCNVLIFILIKSSVTMENIDWYTPLVFYILILIVLLLTISFLKQLFHKLRFEREIKSYFTFRSTREILPVSDFYTQDARQPSEINNLTILRFHLNEFDLSAWDKNGLVSGQDTLHLYSLIKFSLEGAFESANLRPKKYDTDVNSNPVMISLLNEYGMLSGFLEFTLDCNGTIYLPDLQPLTIYDSSVHLTLAGCLLRRNSDNTTTIEVMSLSNPAAEEILMQILQNLNLIQDVNFLFMKGFRFSELLRKQIIGSNNEEMTILIFDVDKTLFYPS